MSDRIRLGTAITVLTEAKLKDKQVVVTGKCIDYKGQPELEISQVKQLQVIELSS